MGKKALALLSGGLDSRLAVKMMLDQGIEVEAVNFVTVFCTCTAKSSCKSEARKAAEEFGIKLKTLNATQQLLEAIRNSRHGFGRGINPCLDCRISMFQRAGVYMKEAGADFLVTGEVWGERPMSQRPDALETIERKSGLAGLIVRPLSAHLFEPSIPEREGWVDRERMMAIQGRSRKPQMQLAAEIGVFDYPCPAGGCLLCDRNFAARLKHLLDEDPYPPIARIQALKLGRLFISSEGRSILIPRNEEETKRLAALARPEDMVMSIEGHMGPTTLIRDGADLLDGNSGAAPVTVREAASLTARFCQARDADFVTASYAPAADGAAGGHIEVSPRDGWRLSGTLERL